jgi:hypothetical protein
VKAFLLVTIAATLFLGGCAGMGDESEQPYDKMITQQTNLYRQGTGDSLVERSLEPGTRVRIIGLSGDGRVEVQTVSGDRGFVDRLVVGDQPWAN